MSINPKEYKPGQFVSMLLERGAPPTVTVPFPRRGSMGEVLAEVTIRPLSQTEEDVAFANAAKYVARLLGGDKDSLPWPEDELRHNARCAEILAVACRQKEDPSKPVFEDPRETRFFSTDELGQLMLASAEVKDKSWPGMRELMVKGEVDVWARYIAEGAPEHPFISFTRIQVEHLASSLARRLVELLDSNPTSSSGSDSE